MEHKHPSSTNLAEATNSLAKDPVCGMSVDPATAKHQAEHDGKTFFFCCAGCRGKFVADPARYLAEPSHAPTGSAHGHAHHATAAPSLTPAPPGAIYTCPMHPEIRQDHPGACPICGMALEPEIATDSDGPERRARGHDPALLGGARALHSCLSA